MLPTASFRITTVFNVLCGLLIIPEIKWLRHWFRVVVRHWFHIIVNTRSCKV